ncbi:hypothetical protein WJR50_34040 [Catalinimonas sp. 4WD22]|uniref:hypothetical protein n=1 Tax=Catalinimonas locisalis TaxID=3133978 RepID=UPI003100E2D1
MATSFVKYREFGFWAKDSFLEGLLYLSVRELKVKVSNKEWLVDIVEDWIFASTVGYVGCIPVDLDKKFDSEEKRLLLISVLQNIIASLETEDNYLTVEELNKNKIGTGGWQKINTNGFIDTAKQMLKLMSGDLRTNASSPIDYLEN